jgi:hypothetical protein
VAVEKRNISGVLKEGFLMGFILQALVSFKNICPLLFLTSR